MKYNKTYWKYIGQNINFEKSSTNFDCFQESKASIKACWQKLWWRRTRNCNRHARRGTTMRWHKRVLQPLHSNSSTTPHQQRTRWKDEKLKQCQDCQKNEGVRIINDSHGHERKKEKKKKRINQTSERSP